MTSFLQSNAGVQDCNIDEETMRKQVSDRTSFLMRTEKLGRSTRAEMVAALVPASSVGVVSAVIAPVPVAVPTTLSSSVIWIRLLTKQL